MDKPFVDHIGILVPDIDKAIAMFQRLFNVPVDWSKDRPDLGVRIAFLETANVTLELLQYTDQRDDFVRRTMGTTIGVNHVCFRVGDVQHSIEHLAGEGVPITEGFPTRGAHGEVAFFDPAATEGCLLEVCRPTD